MSVLTILPTHRYQALEASSRAGIDVPLPQTWTETEVENWLMVHATAVNADRPIEIDVDVFEQGFDRSVCSHLYVVRHSDSFVYLLT